MGKGFIVDEQTAGRKAADVKRAAESEGFHPERFTEYDGYENDLQSIYDYYSSNYQPEIFTNQAVQGLWKSLLDAVNELAKTKITGGIDSAYDHLINVGKKCNMALPQDLEQYNASYASETEKPGVTDSKTGKAKTESPEEKQERWMLYRLKNQLWRSIGPLKQNMELKYDSAMLDKKYAQYILSYGQYKKDMTEMAEDFAEFESYEEFEKQLDDVASEKRHLEWNLSNANAGEDTASIENNLENLKNLRAGKTMLLAQRQPIAAQKEENDKLLHTHENLLREAQEAQRNLEQHKSEAEQKFQAGQKAVEGKKAQLLAEQKRLETLYLETESLNIIVENTRGKYTAQDNEIKSLTQESEDMAKIAESLDIIDKHYALLQKVEEFQETLFPEDGRKPTAKNQDSYGFSAVMAAVQEYADASAEEKKEMLTIPSYAAKFKLNNQYMDLYDQIKEQFMAYKPTREETEKFERAMNSEQGMVDMAKLLVKKEQAKVDDIKDKNRNIANRADDLEECYQRRREYKKALILAEKLAEPKMAELMDTNNYLKSAAAEIEKQEEAVKKLDPEYIRTQLQQKIRKETENVGKLQENAEKLQTEISGIDVQIEKIDGLCANEENYIRMKQGLVKCTKKLRHLQEVGDKLDKFHRKAAGLVEQVTELKTSLGIDENGQYGKKYASQMAEDIFAGLKTLHETAAIGKKPGHTDTQEYRGMMDRFDALIGAGEEEMRKKTPEQIQGLLAELKTGAEEYIKAKEAQSFQSFRHSPMRKTRLDFAKQLIRMCTDSRKQLDKLPDRIAPMQEKYRDCAKLLSPFEKDLDHSAVVRMFKSVQPSLTQNKPELQQKVPTKTVATAKLGM